MLKSTNTKATDELKRLKEAEKDFKNHRQNAMKELESQVKKSQKTAASIRDELNKIFNKRDGLLAEVEGLQKELVALTEQQNICVGGLKRFDGEIETLSSQVRRKSCLVFTNAIL